METKKRLKFTLAEKELFKGAEDVYNSGLLYTYLWDLHDKGFSLMETGWFSFQARTEHYAHFLIAVLVEFLLRQKQITTDKTFEDFVFNHDAFFQMLSDYLQNKTTDKITDKEVAEFINNTLFDWNKQQIMTPWTVPFQNELKQIKKLIFLGVSITPYGTPLRNVTPIVYEYGVEKRLMPCSMGEYYKKNEDNYYNFSISDIHNKNISGNLSLDIWKKPQPYGRSLNDAIALAKNANKDFHYYYDNEYGMILNYNEKEQTLTLMTPKGAILAIIYL